MIAFLRRTITVNTSGTTQYSDILIKLALVFLSEICFASHNYWIWEWPLEPGLSHSQTGVSCKWFDRNTDHKLNRKYASPTPQYPQLYKESCLASNFVRNAFQNTSGHYLQSYLWLLCSSRYCGLFELPNDFSTESGEAGETLVLFMFLQKSTRLTVSHTYTLYKTQILHICRI